MKIRAISVQPQQPPALVYIRRDSITDYYALTDGGYMAALQHPSGATMYLNEDPVSKDLPINVAASEVLRDAGMLGDGRAVFGGVVIVGPLDDDGWDTDAPNELVSRLCSDDPLADVAT